MGLLSDLKRGNASGAKGAASPASTTPDAVLEARTRARRRLVGAAVLLGIGIVGFPLVFETQPRPIPVDVPIELPRKDGAPPMAMPAARSDGGEAPSASIREVPATPAAPPEPKDIITETPAQAGREIAPAPAPAASPAARAAPPTARAASARPTPATVAEASPPAPRAAPAPADGERARALLDGKTASAPSPAAAGRFVVQVGAFADAGAARETRLKVEKLGLKTYTQVATTAAGDRIRVRAGPFSTRDEADRALAKARSAGLSAVVLTL